MWSTINKFFTKYQQLETQHRVYLDHAAATPLSSAVAQVMAQTQTQFANPSAIHQEGVAARRVVESARAKLARCLKARPEHVTFTGSGTESNNLAILGTLYARHAAGVAYEDMEIITTAIEHPSVTEACAYAASLGVTVKTVPVDEGGLVDPKALDEFWSEKTTLVTLAYINSEIGVVQPLPKITRATRKAEQDCNTRIYVHADAAQAPYWETCQMDRLGVDILTLDAGKCGGPKGVGVLVSKHGVELQPVLFGGPQEGGLRPATENTTAIAAAMTAIVAAQASYETAAETTKQQRDRLLAALTDLERVIINGSLAERVANNVNVSVLGIDSEWLTVSLDEAGVAASTKSACSGASGGGSRVVKTISGDAARAESTLRLTLGPNTTDEEITYAITIITDTIKKLQAQQIQAQQNG